MGRQSHGGLIGEYCEIQIESDRQRAFTITFTKNLLQFVYLLYLAANNTHMQT